MEKLIKRLIDRDIQEKVLLEHFSHSLNEHDSHLLVEFMAVIDKEVPDEMFDAPRDVNVIGEELNYLEWMNKALSRQIRTNEYQIEKLSKELKMSMEAMKTED